MIMATSLVLSAHCCVFFPGAVVHQRLIVRPDTCSCFVPSACLINHRECERDGVLTEPGADLTPKKQAEDPCAKLFCPPADTSALR